MKMLMSFNIKLCYTQVDIVANHNDTFLLADRQHFKKLLLEYHTQTCLFDHT